MIVSNDDFSQCGKERDAWLGSVITVDELNIEKATKIDF